MSMDCLTDRISIEEASMTAAHTQPKPTTAYMRSIASVLAISLAASCELRALGGLHLLAVPFAGCELRAASCVLFLGFFGFFL